MKIEKIYILSRCNLSHPDFGTFASFLDGLSVDENGKKQPFIEIGQPTKVFLCKECSKPLWSENVPCLYCKGVEDCKKSMEVPVLLCKHTWTAQEEKSRCIKCNVFQHFIIHQSSD